MHQARSELRAMRRIFRRAVTVAAWRIHSTTLPAADRRGPVPPVSWARRPALARRRGRACRPADGDAGLMAGCRSRSARSPSPGPRPGLRALLPRRAGSGRGRPGAASGTCSTAATSTGSCRSPTLDELAGAAGPAAGRQPVITFEPGGQLELSAPPVAGVDAACDALAGDRDVVAAALGAARAGARGGRRRPAPAAGRQLRQPRYDAMERVLRRRRPRPAGA